MSPSSYLDDCSSEGREEIAASDSTIRRALHEAVYRWKRPRFVLTRRSPTWRQAKGGSAGA